MWVGKKIPNFAIKYLSKSMEISSWRVGGVETA
jgi:hypothetical protein